MTVSTNIYMQRAIEMAQMLKSEYENIEDEIFQDINIPQMELLLNGASLLEGIFVEDLVGDERITDPLCRILDPLIKALRKTHDKVWARKYGAHPEIKNPAC